MLSCGSLQFLVIVNMEGEYKGQMRWAPMSGLLFAEITEGLYAVEMLFNGPLHHKGQTSTI
jgi:hypothetical protein